MEFKINSFPANLLYRVFRTKEAAEEAMKNKDIDQTLHYVLHGLTKRESQIIENIYVYGLSYAETAKKLGISRSRVGHINNDIIRKLRSAKNVDYLYFGIEESNRRKIQVYKNEAEKKAAKAYDKGFNDGYEKGLKDGTTNAVKMQDRTKMPITVLNVSNRVIDDLFTHGIRTVGDLLCIENFRIIRDIGIKHNIAIIAALKEIGIDYENMEDLSYEEEKEKN